MELMVCDLSIQRSVRGLAKEFAASHRQLHILVNNAAIVIRRRILTEDGLELMLATNHLGPFLLTNLLLELLKAGAPSRIITVSAPSTTKLDFDNLQGEKRFRPLWAFGASKMANLLFTYELAKHLEGSGVTANVLHPGLMRSGLMREAPLMIRLVTSRVSKGAERAAEALIHLAASPEVQGVTGSFFKGRRIADSNPYSRDRGVQRRLWEASANLTGLDHPLQP